MHTAAARAAQQAPGHSCSTHITHAPKFECSQTSAAAIAGAPMLRMRVCARRQRTEMRQCNACTCRARRAHTRMPQVGAMRAAATASQAQHEHVDPARAVHPWHHQSRLLSPRQHTRRSAAAPPHAAPPHLSRSKPSCRQCSAAHASLEETQINAAAALERTEAAPARASRHRSCGPHARALSRTSRCARRWAAPQSRPARRRSRWPQTPCAGGRRPPR